MCGISLESAYQPRVPMCSWSANDEPWPDDERSDRENARVIGGSIDEPLAARAVATRHSGRLVLDSQKFEFINSIGVRDWIRMQAAAAAGWHAVDSSGSPKPMVHQLNISVGDARGTSVVSVVLGGPTPAMQCGREQFAADRTRFAHAARLARLELLYVMPRNADKRWVQ